MRVLVTGGTGFAGSHSVAALLSQGHQVRLLVRSPDQVARSLSRSHRCRSRAAGRRQGRGEGSRRGTWISALEPHCDDSKTASELGITARDPRVTLEDTVRRLVNRGRLSAARPTKAKE